MQNKTDLCKLLIDFVNLKQISITRFESVSI